jgi:hypothetical protein
MEKKHLQILQHPKISIETSRGTYCNMGKRVSVAEPQRAATRETLPPQQGSTGPRRAMRKPRRFRSSAPGLRCSSPPGSRRGFEELVRMRLPTAAPHEALTGARSSLDGALTAARAKLALLPRAGAPPARASPATPPGRGGHDDMAPGLGEQRAMLDRSAARALASAPPPSSQHPLPCTGCIGGERERHGDGGWLFWGTEGMTVSQRYKANRGRDGGPARPHRSSGGEGVRFFSRVGHPIRSITEVLLASLVIYLNIFSPAHPRTLLDGLGHRSCISRKKSWPEPGLECCF